MENTANYEASQRALFLNILLLSLLISFFSSACCYMVTVLIFLYIFMFTSYEKSEITVLGTRVFASYGFQIACVVAFTLKQACFKLPNRRTVCIVPGTGV
jgi:hypothetical protein